MSNKFDALLNQYEPPERPETVINKWAGIETLGNADGMIPAGTPIGYRQIQEIDDPYLRAMLRGRERATRMTIVPNTPPLPQMQANQAERMRNTNDEWLVRNFTMSREEVRRQATEFGLTFEDEYGNIDRRE